MIPVIPAEQIDLSAILVTVATSIGAILLGVLSYVGMEIRRDVRAMNAKVTILWDRSERSERARRERRNGNDRRHRRQS